MQFGIHIIINHLTLSPVEVGRAVEERGFDSLFVGEHTHIPVRRETAYIGIDDRSPPQPGEGADELRKRRPDLRQNFWYLYDPFVALAAAAAVTERIKLGTAICLIPERDPITLAQEIATLDQISNGRVIIGIGSGWNREEMANHGVAWKDRFKVTRERVEAMRALWTDDEAEFHGETVDFDPVWCYPKPVQEGGPPILLGQNSPRTFERIVRYCDGWIPYRIPIGDPEILPQVTELRRQWADAGRDPAALHVSMNGPAIPAAAGDDPAEADPAALDAAVAEAERLREGGVDRLLFNLGSPKRDLGYPTLDRYASFLARVT